LEERFNFERVFGFDFQADNGALFGDGDEKSFAYVVGVTGVEDGDGFGACGDGASERCGIDDAVVGVKAEVKVAQDF